MFLFAQKLILDNFIFLFFLIFPQIQQLSPEVLELFNKRELGEMNITCEGPVLVAANTCSA